MSVACSARPGASFLSCRGRKTWLRGHEVHCDLWTGAGGCAVGKGLHLEVGCKGVSVPSCLLGTHIPITLSRAGEELPAPGTSLAQDPHSLDPCQARSHPLADGPLMCTVKRGVEGPGMCPPSFPSSPTDAPSTPLRQQELPQLPERPSSLWLSVPLYSLPASGSCRELIKRSFTTFVWKMKMKTH